MSVGKLVFSSIDIMPDKKYFEKDADGYYKVTLGAFNCFNSAGEFYLLNGVEEILTNSSGVFLRRIKSGSLKGEVGHPPFIPGMTSGQYYARNMRIDMENVSHNIREVSLVPTALPSGITSKGNTVMVDGWVKPAGPKGDALKQDMDDPNVNVAFSIRCITHNTVIGGVTHKELESIITWDWVLEPGIKIANKFDRLNKTGISIESRDICDIDMDLLMNSGKLPSMVTLGLEDEASLALTNELIRKVQRNQSLSNLTKW